jgi:hypothetical protein
VFGVENAIRMLQYKIDDAYWPVVKTCLLYLEYIDEEFDVEIPLDEKTVKRMREL